MTEPTQHPSPGLPDAFSVFVLRYLEGDLSEDERLALERVLLADDRACRQFVQASMQAEALGEAVDALAVQDAGIEGDAPESGVWMEVINAAIHAKQQEQHRLELERAQLVLLPDDAASRPIEEPGAPRVLVIPRPVFWGAIAAVLLLVGSLVYLSLPGQSGSSNPAPLADDPRPVPAAPAAVATVTWLSNDAAVPAEATQPRPGDRLTPGTYTLEAGEVMVRFDTGAEVTLSAPASLEIIGQGVTALHRGRLRAEVPPSGHGFRVVVPGGSITDLGTAFTVAINELEERAHVEVTRGLVQVDSAAAGQPKRSVLLRADQYAHLANDGRQLLAYQHEDRRIDLGLRSTGLGAVQGPVPMHGDPDPNWVIVSDGQEAPAYVIQPTVLKNTETDLFWLASDARSSQWLSPVSDGRRLVTPDQSFRFQSRFTIPEGVDLASVELSGRFIADNLIDALLINGVQLAGPYPPPIQTANVKDPRQFRTWQDLDIRNLDQALRHGENTIELVLQNGLGHAGMRVELQLTGVLRYRALETTANPDTGL